MKKITLSILLASAFLLAACGASSTPTTPAEIPQPAPTAAEVSQSPTNDTTTPQQSGQVSVNISGFAFSPAELTIKIGTTVTWTNQDSVVHNVLATDNSWGSPDMNQGDTFSHTFDKAGTYTYRCSFHPGMKGTITVID
jgi:plastocyanin